MSQTANETGTGIPSGKLGIWLFLASEVMLFGAFISSYVILRVGSSNFIVPSRELMGVPLATLNTFLLITSSVSMVMAYAASEEGNLKGVIRNILITIALGGTFLCIKSYEYYHKIHEGLTISSNLFGSFYFTLTGLHALHIIGGLIFMLYILVMAVKGKWDNFLKGRIEYAGLYWHFVDLVWVILFPLFYLL